MANVRDSDTSLWLHNKLGTSNDSWTGGSICSQLNGEVLRNIKDCFPDLQTQVKLKLLLSFFHIPRRNIEEWRLELDQIIDVAVSDSELWVSMLAESLKTFPATGSLNTEISDLDDVRPIFTDLVTDLKKLVKKQAEHVMLPMECHYLNKGALVSVVGQQPAPTKHFTLKKKPKSAVLRADLLQKSNDAASNLKKASAPVIPVRSRGMPRKMTDTTPLKGIPSRVPSSGFRSALLNNTLPNRPPIAARPPAGRKEGGVKLLDIADQPLGYAAAKKRKKLQELEEASKKTAAVTATATEVGGLQSPPAAGSGTTPDYAVGLLTPGYAPATPQPTVPPTVSAAQPTISSTTTTTTITLTATPQQSSSTPTAPSSPPALTPTTTIVTSTPSTNPSLPPTLVVSKTITIAPSITTTSLSSAPPPVSSLSTTTKQQQQQLVKSQQLQQQQLVKSQQQLPAGGGLRPLPPLLAANSAAAAGLVAAGGGSVITTSGAATGAAGTVVIARPVQQVTQIRLQPQPATALQRRGLALTRDQMIEAQEMFRTANKVTRPEKALILGFMAGSRDNPCPHLGNIVTIKLSEDQENVMQTDNTYVSMLVETHFQMNYNNGEWKRIKKYRHLEGVLGEMAGGKQQQTATGVV